MRPEGEQHLDRKEPGTGQRERQGRRFAMSLLPASRAHEPRNPEGRAQRSLPVRQQSQVQEVLRTLAVRGESRDSHAHGS